MEAPERIILSQDKESGIINDYWVLHDYTTTNNKIEYVRTDAFIDKACEWLSNHVNDYIINDKYILSNGKMSRDWLKVKSEIFDDFRKYMKGK